MLVKPKTNLMSFDVSEFSEAYFKTKKFAVEHDLNRLESFSCNGSEQRDYSTNSGYKGFALLMSVTLNIHSTWLMLRKCYVCKPVEDPSPLRMRTKSPPCLFELYKKT